MLSRPGIEVISIGFPVGVCFWFELSDLGFCRASNLKGHCPVGNWFMQSLAICKSLVIL